MTTLAATDNSAPRIRPLEAPYPEPIADLLARMNPPGRAEVLALFRVLAINPELAEHARWGSAAIFSAAKPQSTCATARW